MILYEFVEKFIESNSIIRLLYKTPDGHNTIKTNWNDVCMEWEILKKEGIYKEYINRPVLGIASIFMDGIYREAINIVIGGYNQKTK